MGEPEADAETITEAVRAAVRWQEYLPIADLVGAEVNPKDHDEEEIGASLDRFGYVEPIVMDERTGRLVVGHGRLDQLRAKHTAGEDAPEGIQVLPDGTWVAPIARGWSSTDDTEAEAYLIASNAIGPRGGWFQQGLAEMLERIRPSGLVGVGFSSDQVIDLLARISPPPTLDELEQQHGQPQDDAFWPVLRFKVAPEVRDRYQKIIAGRAGTDGELFAYLLELAER